MGCYCNSRCEQVVVMGWCGGVIRIVGVRVRIVVIECGGIGEGGRVWGAWGEMHQGE
jgi:hypothetical protein